MTFEPQSQVYGKEKLYYGFPEKEKCDEKVNILNIIRLTFAYNIYQDRQTPD